VTDREVVLATGSAGRPRGRARTFVANRSAPAKLGVLGAVLVLLTAPFGGLKSQAAEDVRPLELGQRMDIGPFYVTIEKVSQVSDLQPAISPEADNKLLVIKVEVTNHSDRAELSSIVTNAIGGDHTGAVAWPDDPAPRPKVFSVDDASGFNEYVNPGQTYTWALVLQQQPDTDLDQITFEVFGYFFQEVDPQTLDPNRWVLDDDPLAEGHVPVEVQE
jgi:hypothetical protein